MLYAPRICMLLSVCFHDTQVLLGTAPTLTHTRKHKHTYSLAQANTLKICMRVYACMHVFCVCARVCVVYAVGTLKWQSKCCTFCTN